jgi:hypothetical protein
MVKNPEILAKFEDDLIEATNNSYEKRLATFQKMLDYRNFVLKDIDPYDGLDEKIEFIKRLHRAKRAI